MSTKQNLDISQLLMKIKESSLFWKLKGKILGRVRQQIPQNSIGDINASDIQMSSAQDGYEEQLRQLILNYASKSIKRDPISVDSLEFINQNKIKWSELLIKNFDYIHDKIKTTQTQEGQEQEDILYFYDHVNMLTFLTQIKNTSCNA